MEPETRRTQPLPELLTVKEYAAWYRVTERTVYKWVADGAVPVRRVGRLVRILSDDPDETEAS